MAELTREQKLQKIAETRSYIEYTRGRQVLNGHSPENPILDALEKKIDAAEAELFGVTTMDLEALFAEPNTPAKALTDLDAQLDAEWERNKHKYQGGN
jgi:hypothetical protein